MNRKSCLLKVIFLMIPGLLLGQSALETIGLGMPIRGNNAVSLALGGITTIAPQTDDAMLAAPASWYRARRTMLSTTIEQFQASLGEDAFGRTILPVNFQFLIHLDNRSAIGFRLNPITRTDVSEQWEGIQNIVGSDTLVVNHFRRTQGGISALGIGYSRRLTDNVSFGVVWRADLGSFEQKDTLEFIETGNYLDLLEHVLANRQFAISGSAIELSSSIQFDGAKAPELGIRLVAPFEHRLKQTVLISSIADTALTERSTFKMPLELALGLGFAVTPRQRVLSEAYYYNWDNTAVLTALFGMRLDKETGIRLAWTRTPGANEELAIARLYYRLGLHRSVYYLSPLNKGQINEIGLSFGIGYRHPKLGHRLNIGLEFGRRSGDLQYWDTEKYARIALEVSTGERWFVRPQKNWDK